MSLRTRKVMRVGMIGIALLAVLVAGMGVLLAQEGSRQLISGVPRTASLDSETFAQTFWFQGLAGQAVTLFASTSDDELALALLLTDAEGDLLAQDSDPETPGSAAIANFALEQEGRYYVTVMRLSGAQGEGEGTFSLTFVLADEEETTAVATPTAVATEAGAGEVPIAAQPSLVALDAGIQVSVSWNSTADLDLEVRDPFGNSIYWDNPTAENAIYDRNVNANCQDTTADNPTEFINWSPGASPVGSYEVIVYYVQGCDNNAPVNLAINVVVDGEALDEITGTLLPGQEFLSSFRVSANGQAMPGPGGVNPGLALADTTRFLTGQIPIEPGSSVSGFIDGDNVYETYSFTGSAGSIITLRMDAISGNLDTLLYLLDPNGTVVASNDDALDTVEVTDSEIANQTLVSDGLYTVVATRYGQQYGGTEGEYTLTFTGGEFEVPPALAGLDLPGGSIEVSLLWNTNADLQLLVRDPAGASVYDDIPQINSGGVLAEDGNVNCVDTTTSPVSYIYWPPDRLPPGTYEVAVWYQNTCNDTTPVTFSLTVRVNGQVIISTTAQPSPGQTYLTNFTVDVNGFGSAGRGGFIDGVSMLDLGQALAGAIPIGYGDTVSGTINQANKFVLYTFEGEAGDQVRIGMQATAGTLDTTLFLLSPDGAQLAMNDDAVVNETTDSLIDTFTLPADGTYTIVATHYGLLYGGTSGTYNLSLTRLN